jgi:prepilin-type N-terminal cleavage/methylation domain-containing protein
MKRTAPSAGFTLIEMITVMAVIAILASLVLAINGYVQKKSATLRATGEIEALSTAIERFKADNGDVPRDEATTDALDPRQHGAPITGSQKQKFLLANQELYKALSGDKDLDGKINDGETEYAPDFFKPKTLHYETATGSSKKIDYIQDPYGNAYGYSTAGAAAEQEYREKLRKGETDATREQKGYNPHFDLWSTGGLNTTKPTDQDRNRWIKNW